MFQRFGNAWIPLEKKVFWLTVQPTNSSFGTMGCQYDDDDDNDDEGNNNNNNNNNNNVHEGLGVFPVP